MVNESTTTTPNTDAPTDTGKSRQRTGFFRSVFQDSRNVDGDKLQDSGVDHNRESGTGNTESGNTANAGNAKRSPRNSGESTQGRTETGESAGRNQTGTTTGSQEKASTVGDGFTVEEPTPKPRRGRPRGSRNRSTSKGAIKPEHIAGMTVQIFHLAAVMKQAPWWNVEDEKELDFWTPQAAELANKYIDEKAAEKALEFNAAVTVCLGVGIMVMKRITVDTMMRRQSVAAQTPKDEPKAKPHPQEPKPTNVHPMNRNPNHSGGAAPTRPDEPIEGLGLTQPGLS